jgi:PAS domain-containing protein
MGTVAGSHSVQFYEDDAFLIAGIAHFVGSAFETGNSAVVVATESHRDKVAERLEMHGFDVHVHRTKGSYLALDAQETLSKFMVNSRPEPERFFEVIGNIAATANLAAECERPCAAIFGEMVAILWAEGKQNAAIQLEQLWNDLSRRSSFSLMCGYPMKSFSRANHRMQFARICAEHRDVTPPESYSALTKDEERRRVVARLIQKAQAMEAETRLNLERMSLLQSVAQMGTLEIDLLSGRITLSPEAQRILGTADDIETVTELLTIMPYSSDRHAFKAAMKKARAGRKEFAAGFRLGRNGSTRVISAVGKAMYNAGQPLILGVLKDKTSVGSK